MSYLLKYQPMQMTLSGTNYKDAISDAGRKASPCLAIGKEVLSP